MEHFADRLTAAVDAKQSCVVVGLDPRLESLPEPLRERAQQGANAVADAVFEFNCGVIEAVAPHAVAVKPQVAFYEALGWQGFKAYVDTVRFARDRGLLVIADVKRNDIGSTAEAYAHAHLDVIDADAVTVNPYLGTDGIKPFLERAPRGKGIFVLVKTSNPSSVELQDLDTGGATVHERVAELVRRWGEDCCGESGYSAAGAVVGATFPGAIRKLRELMPRAVFLVPGYGAQGGGAEDCRACFDEGGHGAVVNSSRGIIFAFSRAECTGGDWQQAVADAAKSMKEDLERVRARGD